ncbi:F-box/kelch-repeat protein At3g23880-like [Silene latifolia]|uniref:F-box/kelch-repeat protein At3g23880-like n=1 Tax=Silene latifolia TaxID=37657 RepID=UPI003D785B14
MGDKHPTNAKKKQVIDQQPYLSDDFIIEEILTRLPVKSVLRFKSVSKQWYSALSSSEFANVHLMRSPFSHPSAPVNSLFIKNLKNYYLVSFDDDDQISGNFEDNMFKLDVDFGIEYEEYLQFIGCSNGLICLTIFFHPSLVSISDDSYLILWNPATRKLHKYESGCYLKHMDDDGRSAFVARGFGYASSVDDYKYVRILRFLGRNKRNTIIVHIFSVRENKWRKIDFDFDFDCYFDPQGRAMLIDEKLYWESLRMSGDRIVIGSFDLEVERFEIHEFNLGDPDFFFDSFNSLLGVMGDCLSKLVNSMTNRSDTLMHILESPTRTKSICLPKGLLLDKCSQMIGFTKTGKIFVTGGFRSDVVRDDRSNYQSALQLLDIGRKPMQHSILMKFNGLVNIAKYVPSFASPCPIELSKT